MLEGNCGDRVAGGGQGGNFGLHLLQMDHKRACSKKQNWKRAKLLVEGGRRQLGSGGVQLQLGLKMASCNDGCRWMKRHHIAL